MRKSFLILSSLAFTLAASADNMLNDYTLSMPDVYVPGIEVPTTQQLESMDLHLSLDANTADDDPFAIDEPVKYYKNFLGEKCIDFGDAKPYYNWKRDVTYAGIPIFLSSFLIKGQKKAFRSARHTFQNKFSSEIDNYTQFAPYVAMVGMKAAGYSGRSDWPRLLSSTLLSNAVMATFVNATKYTVKEMRPDNSTRNSFPSGHTATAFTAATIFHKEYGLTRSPWYSVGGYAVATATGVMRVLNNRHWISDVVAGAGIGIMSTELGYFIGDMLWKNKGIMNKELITYRDPDHPSFFDIQMGIGLHSNRIDFTYDDEADSEMASDYIELGTSTVFGVEGAYFINKYLGFGGMARVTTTPAKGIGITDEDRNFVEEINSGLESYNLPGIYNMRVENDNYIDTSLDAGVYGNFPINKYLDLGAKALIGCRLTGGISYMARNGYRQRAGTFVLFDEKGNAINDIDNNLYYYEATDGSKFISSPVLDNEVNQYYNYALEDASEEYELLSVSGKNSLNYVLGLSLTWHYKENFAWKFFVDFDSSKNKYTYTQNLLSDEAREGVSKFIDIMGDANPEAKAELEAVREGIQPQYSHVTKRFNLFTIGGSFTINF